MNIDLSTLLPLLMKSNGGAEYGDILNLMSGMKKPRPTVDVNKYFNPEGGPCPPKGSCEKNNDISSEILKLLLEKSLRPSPPPPKKPKEKPCGLRPIASFCGAETMLLMIRLMYG